MPNSFTMEIGYTCPVHGEKTAVSIWLILDVSEHPTLLFQIKNVYPQAG